MIDNLKVIALLDTGATVSLMSPDILKLLNEKNSLKSDADINIKAVNGSEVQISSSYLVNIQIENYHFRHKLYLTNTNLFSPYKVIFGYDFFKSLLVNFNPKNLTLNCDNFSTPIFDFNQINGEINNSFAVPNFKIEQSNPKLKSLMLNMLLKHNNAFASSVSQLSEAKTEPHRIHLDHNMPIRCPSYKIPFQLRDEFRKQIDELESANIISRTNSPYNTPALFVKQKNKYRLVFDFRRLNEITKTQDFIIPTLDEILQEISGSNYFSVLDMKSAFNQIPIHKKDRQKTAFTTPDGIKYCFNRLAFGMKNSPKHFQEVAQQALGELLHNGVLVYVDDVIVFTKTIDDHVELLDKILSRFEALNLKFNPEKCTFLSKQCKFLGFLISNEGIMIDKQKVESINEFPVPKNQQQIKSFLGCCNYYRRYIKNFAKRALPLTALLRKDTPFVWDEITQAAFDDIKNALLKPPVLALPDFNLEFQITTDASQTAVGAVLEQRYPNGETKPIYFYSKKLNPTQSKYSATVLELFAIYSALLFFRPFLIGPKKFFVFTDHKPLLGFLSNKNANHKILRWKLALEEFNYELRYVQGTSNVVADLLSRVVNTMTIEFPTDLELKKFQREDEDLAKIIKRLEDDSFPNYDYFLSSDGLLKHYGKRHKNSPRNREVEQVCVPNVLKNKVLESVHSDVGGHLRFFKTYNRLCEEFYWPNSYTDTKNFINSCQTCLSRRNAFQNNKAEHQPVKPANSPGEICHADIFGPLKKTDAKNVYVLSIVDAFSKNIQLMAVPDVKSKTLCDAIFDNFISIKGCPQILVTDNATYFKSEEFNEFCKMHSIKKKHSLEYSPFQNGKVEKPNQSIANILAAISKDNNWDKLLPKVSLALNSSIHEATLTSPFFLEHGREIRLPYSIYRSQESFSSQSEYVDNMLETLKSAFEKVKINLEKQETKHIELSKRKCNPKRIDFPTGSLCYVRKPNLKSDLSPKLRPRYTGPYEVIERISKITYLIKDTKLPRKTMRIHVNRMSPFIKRFKHLQCPSIPERQEEEKKDIQVKLRKPNKSEDRDNQSKYNLRRKDRIFYNNNYLSVN